MTAGCSNPWIRENIGFPHTCLLQERILPLALAWGAKMSYLVLRTDGLMRLRDTAYRRETESRQQRGILIRWSDTT